MVRNRIKNGAFLGFILTHTSPRGCKLILPWKCHVADTVWCSGARVIASTDRQGSIGRQYQEQSVDGRDILQGKEMGLMQVVSSTAQGEGRCR